jgi:hypothetical protein
MLLWLRIILVVIASSRYPRIALLGSEFVVFCNRIGRRTDIPYKGSHLSSPGPTMRKKDSFGRFRRGFGAVDLEEPTKSFQIKGRDE